MLALCQVICNECPSQLIFEDTRIVIPSQILRLCLSDILLAFVPFHLAKLVATDANVVPQCSRISDPFALWCTDRVLDVREVTKMNSCLC